MYVAVIGDLKLELEMFSEGDCWFVIQKLRLTDMTTGYIYTRDKAWEDVEFQVDNDFNYFYRMVSEDSPRVAVVNFCPFFDAAERRVRFLLSMHCGPHEESLVLHTPSYHVGPCSFIE